MAQVSSLSMKYASAERRLAKSRELRSKSRKMGRATLIGLSPRRLAAMTEKAFLAAARRNPASPQVAEEWRRRLRRMPLAKRVRLSLGLLQEVFAERFGIPLGTLRDWEQGQVELSEAVIAYLQVIAHDPETVRAALRASKSRRRPR